MYSILSCLGLSLYPSNSHDHIYRQSRQQEHLDELIFQPSSKKAAIHLISGIQVNVLQKNITKPYSICENIIYRILSMSCKYKIAMSVKCAIGGGKPKKSDVGDRMKKREREREKADSSNRCYRGGLLSPALFTSTTSFK